MAASHSTASFENYLSSFGNLIDAILEPEIRRVDQVLAAQPKPKPVVLQLPKCAHEEAWGNVAVFHCGAKAVVTDLDSEQPMCLRHFEMVS
jgi:hypothetical protein